MTTHASDQWVRELERELKRWGGLRQRLTTHGYWRWKLPQGGFHIDLPGEHALRSSARGAETRPEATWQRWEGIKREIGRQWPTAVPQERDRSGQSPTEIVDEVRPMTEAEIAERERIEAMMGAVEDMAALSGTHVKPDEDEMRPEYDISGGERGKYAERYREAALAERFSPQPYVMQFIEENGQEEPMVEVSSGSVVCDAPGCGLRFRNRHGLTIHVGRQHGAVPKALRQKRSRREAKLKRSGVSRATVTVGPTDGAGVLEQVRSLVTELAILRRENATLRSKLGRMRKAWESGEN